LDFAHEKNIYASTANPGASELAHELLVSGGIRATGMNAVVTSTLPTVVAERVDSQRGVPVLRVRRSTVRQLAKPSRESTAKAAAESTVKAGAAVSSWLSQFANDIRGSSSGRLESTATHETSKSVFLLLLNNRTFDGDAGMTLAREVAAAMWAGMKICLAHDTDRTGDGCRFDRMFSITPEELVVGGLYSSIAVAINPPPTREVSLSLLAKELGAKQLPRKDSAVSTSSQGRGKAGKKSVLTKKQPKPGVVASNVAAISVVSTPVSPHTPAEETSTVDQV